MKKLDLTTGPIHKRLASLTLPMMLGIISMVAFNLVDTYFVGLLGRTELAALSFTFPVIMIIFSLVQGLGMGATAVIAKSIGASRRDKAAGETTDSLVLSILVTGVFVLIGLLTVKPTFRLLGADENMLPYVSSYMTIWYFALFFVTIPFVGNSAIRATGDAKTPSIIMIFAVIINAILDPILIFGYGPIPKLGLEGAAYATAISRALTLVFSLYILHRREKLIRWSLPSFDLLMACWKTILGIALPAGLSKMIVPIATGIITALLSQYGEFAVAAFGVGSRIEFLAMSILFSLSMSIGPFTGQNFGAGKFDRIKSGMKISSIFSIIWGVLVVVAMIFLSKPISEVFSADIKIVNATILYLSILPLGFGFQGIVQNVNSNLNTLNKPLAASLLILVQMLVLGIPFIYLGSYLMGVEGIFWGLTLTYIVGGVISYYVNQYHMNKIESQQQITLSN